MSAEIVAERLTDRTCEKHPDTRIVEVLFRSDKLKNDWVLGICPICHNEAEPEPATDAGIPGSGQIGC